jgi:hypothetical protein
MEYNEPRFTKRELKQAIWLVIFGSFIITFQLLQYLNSKKSNTKFKELFQNTTNMQEFINDVYVDGTSIQRYNLNLFLSTSQDERNKIIDTRVISEKNVEKAIYKMQQSLSKNKKIPLESYLHFFRLKHSWVKYKAAYHELKLNNFDSKDYYRKNILRPTYEIFLNSISTFFYSSVQNQSNLTLHISKEMEKKSLYLLIFGNIVLLVLILLLCYVIYTESRKEKYIE